MRTQVNKEIEESKRKMEGTFPEIGSKLRGTKYSAKEIYEYR
jgi:hypothetical protein